MYNEPRWEEAETQRPAAIGGAAGDVVETLKAKWKLIVAALVVLGLAYFVYDFFIGGVKEVTVNVENLEGTGVASAGVRIFEKSNPRPIEAFSGTKVLKLRRGEYTIDAVASGYKAASGESCNVTDNTTCTIQLEKAAKANLELELPAVMLIGGKSSGKVTVTNKGNEKEEFELAFEGGFKEKKVSASYDGPIELLPEETKTIDVTLDVGETTKPKKDETFDGIVRLKYTKIKKTAPFKLAVFDTAKVKLGTTRLDLRKVQAGQTIDKEIKITNENKDYALTNVTYSLENFNAEINDEAQVIKWFEFTPPTMIDEIQPGKENAQVLTVRLNAPTNAYSDKITGRLVLKTEVWQKEVPITFELVAKEVEIELSGISDTYTLRKDSSTGTYEKKTDQIVIRNKGNVEMEQVKIDIAPGQGCDSSWAALLGDKLYSSIPPGGKAEGTRIEVKAAPQVPAFQSQICTIVIIYSDPRNPVERKEFRKNFEIRTT